MIKRIIEISSGPARLSVRYRQLVIEREDQPEATVPCEDIGVLLVDNAAVSYTHGVLTHLLEVGAAVIVCGRDHHPAGLLLPIDANTLQSERHRAQIAASKPLQKRLWQTVVGAKIRLQAAVLRSAGGADAGLTAIACRVRSGDPDNREAHAAQRYWPALLGPRFRRHRGGPPPNNYLNYGYMVLRAATARALAGAGLITTLGIHHRHRNNPFCLADDLMEAYRPYVDMKVRGLVRRSEPGEDIDRPVKEALLSVFNEVIPIAGQRTPLLLALHRSAASLADAFVSGVPKLALPDGLPVAPDDADEAAA
ncbi:MAG: type II CRISPR-associated endonuclease Cas1 [Geminicoccaceae bacterium]